MDQYDFAVVSNDPMVVQVMCTDFLEMETLTSELRALIPKLKVTNTANEILPGGQTFTYLISGFSGTRTVQIKWWFIRQLCSHGWEPLGATNKLAGIILYTDNSAFQFRKKSS